MKADPYSFSCQISAIRDDLLDDPAMDAFAQTPAWVTCTFLLSRARPCLEPLDPAATFRSRKRFSRRTMWSSCCTLSSHKGSFWVRTCRVRGGDVLRLQPTSSADGVRKRSRERVEADIELLAAMEFLERSYFPSRLLPVQVPSLTPCRYNQSSRLGDRAKFRSSRSSPCSI